MAVKPLETLLELGIRLELRGLDAPSSLLIGQEHQADHPTPHVHIGPAAHGYLSYSENPQIATRSERPVVDHWRGRTTFLLNGTLYLTIHHHKNTFPRDLPATELRAADIYRLPEAG